MPRKSKIEQLGIGDKIVGYSVSGLSVPQIITKITAEHGNLLLTDTTVDRYIKRRSRDIREKKGIVADNGLQYTVDAVKAEYPKIFDEIKAYMGKWEDNPKAGAAGLKLKLDTLEKMTKWIAGYIPENQVNIQVNVEPKSLADRAKEYAAYFESLKKAEVKDASPKP